jgi:Fe-S-cluster containining protein
LSVTDTAPTIPPLREGVIVELTDAGGAIFDAVLGRRIRLDAKGIALARQLASHSGHPADPIALAEAVGTTPETVVTLTQKLASLDLLDTPRARTRASERLALAAVKAAPGAHLRPMPNAHFACTMCGSCCGGHVIGPVTDAILEGLDPHLPALAKTIHRERRIAKDLFFVLPTQRATPGKDVVCHSSAGSCVFLDDTGLCRIHAKVGGDKKPLPCRIFPWELTATPTGIRVAVQRECRDFLAATSDSTPSIADAHEELTALLTAIPAIPTPKLTPVLRGVELPSWAAYEALEASLLLISQVPTTTAADTFRNLSAALPAPQPTTASTPASPSTFAVWRDRLLVPVRHILSVLPPSDAEVIIRVDALLLLERALTTAHGWVLARTQAPLTPDEDRLLRSHLQHTLWSTTNLRATSVEAGLARVHVEWFLARLFAITRAREVKRFHVTAQDLQDGLANACFLFRHRDLTPVLDELDPLTTLIFLDHLEELTQAADREPDRRTELPKF